MPYRSTLLSIAFMIATAMVIFYLFQERVAGSWLKLAIHPDIQETLTVAAEDQKTLAKLDKDQAETYKQRFDQIQAIRSHLFILETHGRDVVKRYQILLLALLGFIVLATLTLQWLTQRRIRVRIDQLRQPLSVLASGKGTVALPPPSQDVIGRVAEMIGQTARVLTDQREQLRYLEHLSGWQEASRRHAHEIRTPLTAARLETERLEELISEGDESSQETMRESAYSILEELDRIKRFTKEFTAFARVRQPNPQLVEVKPFLTEFCELFSKAWDNMTLNLEPMEEPLPEVNMDCEMIRQVLVNLGNNSSNALAENHGEMVLSVVRRNTHLVIAVRDTGPGIPESMRDRIFEPYATTNKIGEGMGLGLAISRKILLDHQGELQLHQTGPEGTCFHLRIPISDS